MHAYGIVISHAYYQLPYHYNVFITYSSPYVITNEQNNKTHGSDDGWINFKITKILSKVASPSQQLSKQLKKSHGNISMDLDGLHFPPCCYEWRPTRGVISQRDTGEGCIFLVHVPLHGSVRRVLYVQHTAECLCPIIVSYSSRWWSVKSYLLSFTTFYFLFPSSLYPQ